MIYANISKYMHQENFTLLYDVNLMINRIQYNRFIRAIKEVVKLPSCRRLLRHDNYGNPSGLTISRSF